MAIDDVKRIIDAEHEASEMLSSADAEAKKMVADAKRKGQELINTAEARAQREVSDLMEKAEHSSVCTAMEITAKAEGECEKLRILASGRMKQAAAFVIERVVNG